MASFDRLYVNGIGEKLFVIPSYQRGYRWTQHNVTQLLDDLASFTDKEYCLQPLVLQEIDELKKQEIRSNYDSTKWDEYKGYPLLRVVDGQQRLTTISLIAHELGINMPWDIYYATEKKFLSELIDGSGAETINDAFRNGAKRAIKDFNDAEKKIIRLFSGECDQKVCFLEYRIDKNDDDHDTFRRLNDGKTPLTSSELIRALYMVNASGIEDKDRLEISKEWELMEQTLQNEQFWLMFNSVGLKDTPTRVDLLFALVLGVKLDDTKANPLLIFETLDSPIKDSNGKATDKHYDLVKVWNEVLHCFWWMQSCYDDIEIFNYLGWIAKFTDNRAKTIYGEWYAHPAINGFRNRLIVKIQENMKFGNFDEIHYDSSNTEYLRKLFVLFNIYYCNRRLERFRFDLYNNESWDIEHIDSQTLNNLQGEKSQKQWLESAIAEVKLSENVKKELQALETFEQKYNRIIELWSKCDRSVDIKGEMLSGEEKDKLGNLALLNSGINRGYRNSIFPTKRKTLIKDIAGEEEDKSETMRLSKKRIFIPPLTQMAFVKTFTREASKITYWLKQDAKGCREAYKKAYDFFSSPDVVDNQNNDHPSGPQQVDLAIAPPDDEQRDVCRKDNYYDFVTFLNNYRIIIPKIQRLYVQGRRDKHGKKCLNGFATKLVEEVINGRKYSLDMIYGIAKDNNVFLPLDGQQRLTTVLLLSWLLGAVNNEWSFRYETRRTAEVFIEKLLCNRPPQLPPSNYQELRKVHGGEDKYKYHYLPLVREYIRSQNWFLPAWEKDPGIDGMLEMLDSLYDKLIDPVRYEIKKETIKPRDEWSTEKISFYVNFLNVSDRNYDQIFLKMNSRGKELTQWENIKAILDEELCFCWRERINNEWQEKLWHFPNFTQDINALDTKMLSVCELALECAGYDGKISDTYYLGKWLKAEDQEGENRISQAKERCQKLYNICCDFYGAIMPDKALERAMTPAWQEKPNWPNFAADDNDISNEFYKPLLAFYAAKRHDGPQWMRVIWNILENSDIGKTNFKSAFALIDELSKNAANILAFLAKVQDGKGGVESPFASDQVREECWKAKKIFEDRMTATGWETKIRKAENYAFFRGAIRFLFTNADGNVDWEDFDTKWSKAKIFFCDSGVNEPYSCDAKLLRMLLSRINKFGAFWGWSYTPSDGSQVWRDILRDSKLFSAIHDLLCIDIPQPMTAHCEDADAIQRRVVEDLVATEVLAKMPYNVELQYNGHYYLKCRVRGNQDYYFFAEQRLDFLTEAILQGFIQCRQHVPRTKAFYGDKWANIDFIFDDQRFRWLGSPMPHECDVYLLGEDGSKLATEKTADENTVKKDAVEFYCFDVESEWDVDGFKAELDNLIARFEEDKRAKLNSSETQTAPPPTASGEMTS